MTIQDAATVWLDRSDASVKQVARLNHLLAYFGPELELTEIGDRELLTCLLEAEARFGSYTELRFHCILLNQLRQIASLEEFNFPKCSVAQRQLTKLKETECQ